MAGTRYVKARHIEKPRTKLFAIGTSANKRTEPDAVRNDTVKSGKDRDEAELPPQTLAARSKFHRKFRIVTI